MPAPPQPTQQGKENSPSKPAAPQVQAAKPAPEAKTEKPAPGTPPKNPKPMPKWLSSSPSNAYMSPCTKQLMNLPGRSKAGGGKSAAGLRGAVLAKGTKKPDSSVFD